MKSSEMKVITLLLAFFVLSLPVMAKSATWRQRNHKLNKSVKVGHPRSVSVMYSRQLVEFKASTQQKRDYRNSKRTIIQKSPEYRFKVLQTTSSNYLQRNHKFRFTQ